MTPEQAKLKQREDARRRSQQAPRRASSQAVASDQSEVTEEAPAVYRVPQINVPEDLQGVARLIQTELAKIEQSQSILLTLWEKLRSQANEADAVTFSKPIVSPSGNFDSLNAGGVLGDYATQRALNISTYRDSITGHLVPEIVAQVLTEEYGAQAACWFDMYPDATGARQAGNITAYCATFQVNGHRVMPSRNMSDTHSPSIFPQYEDVLNDSDNLNDLKGNWSGCYGNDTNVRATPERNYPIELAGALVVIPAGVQGAGGLSCTQLYYPYIQTGFYKRYYASDVDAWGPWELYGSLSETRRELKQEIYAELLELNSGIVVPVVITD